MGVERQPWGRFVWAMLVVLCGLAACDVSAPRPVASCADLDAAWARADWVQVLHVLTQLEVAGQVCGPESLVAKTYAAHINYATSLEQAGQGEAAIAQYRAGLALDGRRREALDGLARLGALPEPTWPACKLGWLDPPERPSAPPEAFVTVAGDHLAVAGQPFLVRGLNYYPRHAPWERFLTGGDLDEMARELDLIAAAGFNTVRIFLWYEPLFTCAPETAAPDPQAFSKLDALIGLARRRNLRLVITLNDLPDLFFRPLYTDWARYDAQTAFIVARYRDEPGVLAWDLRNEGDLDYRPRNGQPARFRRDEVLGWLAHAAEVVRAHDDRHLITAGWWGDAAETAGAVDVLSFHHWTDASELATRLKALRASHAQPILLEEVGYPGWGEAGEAAQAQMLARVLPAAEQNDVAGWLVWAAFDFEPAQGQAANAQHYFGLWRTDLTRKPALSVLPLVTPVP